EAFEQDLDIHTAVAAQVFGVEADQVTAEQRTHAKIVNFGIIYGVTAYGLSRRIEGLGRAEAQELIDDYRRRFAGINDFLDQCVQEAQDTGHVRTMLGRRRRIEQIGSGTAQRHALGERLAINTVVQGSATGDLIKTAMVNLHRRIHRNDLPLKILVQIHDELLLEAPQDVASEQARIVKEEMEGAMTLRVPLKVDVGIGKDWYSAK
ncbi:MAG: DNA polymerase, partial [Phycisphaeraceae bacterium]|nr:DNA polymerase [Phycisphaeraceae bacterium]